MEALWETLREFLSTLGTLGKAQAVLVPLLASWVFTGMWVYATERKRYGTTRPGRAWLGLFWLPGLVLYYLFPGAASPSVAQPPLRSRRTPETVLAPRNPRGQRGREHDQTRDGSTTGGMRPRQITDKTSDGTTSTGSRADASARRMQAPPFSLEALSGALKGQQLRASATQREVSIGSRVNNTIRLEDPSIAMWHVRLSYEKPGQWTLRVHESAANYRTEVNGSPATVKPLRHRDEIRLGNVRLRFHCPEC